MNDDGSIPRSPSVNWESYNNFRTGNIHTSDGGNLPDLTAQIDETCVACTDDILHVTVRMGNAGTSGVGPVDLVLLAQTDGGWNEMGSVVHDPTDAGSLSATYVFEIPGPVADGITALRVEVDGGDNAANFGDWYECDEANNTMEIAVENPCE